MTDFKTTLLELAEPSDKTYASEDLKALESKSNFVLKSDAVEDLGGPEGSAVFLEYSASSNQPSFAGMLCEDASSNSLGLFLHFYGQKLNDELFYLVLQNFRSMPGRTHQKLSNEPRYRSPFIGDLTRGTL